MARLYENYFAWKRDQENLEQMKKASNMSGGMGIAKTGVSLIGMLASILSKGGSALGGGSSGGQTGSQMGSPSEYPGGYGNIGGR
jgi:hypothetical protein